MVGPLPCMYCSWRGEDIMGATAPFYSRGEWSSTDQGECESGRVPQYSMLRGESTTYDM